MHLNKVINYLLNLFSLRRQNRCFSFTYYCRWLTFGHMINVKKLSTQWHGLIQKGMKCHFYDNTNLKRPDDGWWIGPRNLRVGDKYGASASDGRAFLLELGELANLTVIGSVAPSGICPLSFCMALSASIRWSNRIKPTPLDSPEMINRGKLLLKQWQNGNIDGSLFWHKKIIFRNRYSFVLNLKFSFVIYI